MRRPVLFCLASLLALGLSCSAADDAGVRFFESTIRPLLIEQCYECHSAEKKIKGGLRLDTREGWEKGGDTGPALVPGKPDESLLMTAVRYEDRDFEMPPKKRLAPEQIAALEKWIAMGAPDPRTGEASAEKKSAGMSVEDGRKFWSFVPPKKSPPPEVKAASWPRGDIDRFILAKLESASLPPAPDADPATLLRRLHFDLTGLPPTPEDLATFERAHHSPLTDHQSPVAAAVDRLLASRHFGERWGRHWLDVVRFAQSSGGGRSLFFPDAWRYRDYVIAAFNADKPFDRFIVEQIAGDLLPHESHAERAEQLIAAGFLALGPTNYEEQDKTLLRMDVIDEQLDTIGKAFLGQTVSCARCHDHKFDPIPQRDYYALAGIFRSTMPFGGGFAAAGGVNLWLDRPLPLPPAEEQAMCEKEERIDGIEARLKEAKDASKRAAKRATKTRPPQVGKALAVEKIPGVVVDDDQAVRVGYWKESTHTEIFVGRGYLSDHDEGKGAKTLTFTPTIRESGTYEVRLAYSALASRANNTPVTIFHADGDVTKPVDQRELPPIEGRWVSLGRYRFEAGGQGYVLVSNEGTKGFVTADAVQFLPVALADEVQAGLSDALGSERARIEAEVKAIEKELADAKETGPQRPLAMSVKDHEQIEDAQICIRGNPRNLGERVPRGFLTVAMGEEATLPANQSGRREFAEWIASAKNPLTARVFVNRAWHWLFGAGLVRTCDNFGTTGEKPSHPELLDYLAVRFVEENWSVKKLVREIVLSRAYQLASADNPPSADPDNRLLSRANRRRLEAEAIRDAMLVLSGQLDSAAGGPNLNAAKTGGSNEANAVEYRYKFTDTRRSVYTPVFRNNWHELFAVFDFANPNMATGARTVSTVAPQALFMMNHPFVIEQARAAAGRALAWTDCPDDPARLNRAWREALGRAPSDTEAKAITHFLASAGEDRTAAWAQVFQTLFSSIDFRYLH